MIAKSLPVHPVRALKDNYVWCFPTSASAFAAVDPGEAAPVSRFLKSRQASLSHILLTHHHHDHIGGVDALRRDFKPIVIGAKADAARLPALDQEATDGARLILGQVEARVIATPGHTRGHLLYLVGDALFSGDTLFSYGCGRLFEGTPEQMWRSLLKTRPLPDDTRVFCAHEYTLTNLRFVTDLEPDNAEAARMFDEACRKNDADQPTLPNLLGRERRLNPFLRCDDPEFQAKIGVGQGDPEALFAHLREKRNHY